MTDERRDVACITRRNLLRGGVALLGLGLGAAVLRPFGALAAPGDPWRVVHVASFDDVPITGIELSPFDFVISEASSVSVTGELEYDREDQQITVPLASGEPRAFDGTAVLVWESVAIDEDNTRLDCELTISDVYATSCRLSYPVPEDRNKILCQPWNSAASRNMLALYDTRDHNNYDVPPIGMTVRIRFLRHGTNELAKGGFYFFVRDIDVLCAANDDYSEGVVLKSGFENPVYALETTRLRIDTATGHIREGALDGGSLTCDPRDQFAILAAPDFSFEWRGAPGCGTFLFDSLTTVFDIDVRVEFVGGSPRPTTVHLDGTDGSARDLAMSSGNDWEDRFMYLPHRTEEGESVSYSLRADPLPGFTCEVSGSESEGFVVTYTAVDGYVQLEKRSAQGTWI